ncbi:DNA polymerase theta [Cryptosporidium sp. chipmunk genotype I]|uniref:DNA polymerase theta n=1 Tax=Cryptosporidium sp. chipmunk genotype I TaxID=1280935 RepID=UPI00351AAF9E|nr:DNA polymerase theta [Cryptosporidium sp. chipmunk genotype I]
MQNERSKLLNNNAKTLTTVSKFYTHLNNLLIISPRRRLGIWRRVFGEKGEPKKCFVSVSGDSVLEPECFGVAKRELSILEEKGVSLRGYNSSLNKIMDLKPFSDLKGHDIHSLSYWYIPNSVKHQYYLNYNISRLSDWQVNTLSQILNYMVLEEDLLIGKQDYMFATDFSQALSPYLIISSNVSENQTICEIVALNSLLYSGGNILAIFPNPQKCDAYYQRCKSLFGENSLNLRIELFGQSSRAINTTWFPNIDLTICTLEKANSLINRLISDNMLSECIKTIIVDDINFIEDPEKGHLLENILTKISYVNLVNDFYIRGNNYKEKNGSLTCLYVSNGEIFNLDTYKDVLKVGRIFENHKYDKECEPDVYIKRGSNLYFWNKVTSNNSMKDDKKFEVIEIFKNYKNNNIFQQTAISDLKYFSDLILESLINNKKALVFCPTIEWCRKSLQTVSMEISEIVSNKENNIKSMQNLENNGFRSFSNQIYQDKSSRVAIIEKLKKASKNGLQIENDFLLFDGILNYGVAIHNSKLSFKERKVIEDAFKNNHLKVLFCTSLHMMDSEIKADRIIIRSIGLGKINNLTKNKTGNREWISKNTLKQFFSRISHCNFEFAAKMEMHASSNTCTLNLVEAKGFKKGIFIFTGNDLEFKYLNNMLNESNFQSLEFKSHLSELNLFRLILELVQTDLVKDIQGLELLISKLTFRGSLEGPKFHSLLDTFLRDHQKLSQTYQDKGLNKDMLLSLSFMVINQLLSFDLRKEDCNIGEISLSGKYVQQFQDKFVHLKSPIISSKYALIGSKTKDKLNKSILNIIIRQNDLLAKLGSGRKYLLSFFSSVGSCIGEWQIFGTCLANALIQSQLHPCIALEVYSDLVKSKLLGIDLSNNLQIFILGLLAYNGSHLRVNWNNYLQIFSELAPAEMEIADLYGVNFKVIGQILRTVTSNSNLIPDLSKLSPISIQLSYFYSETLNFKGMVEKYRLIYIYRLYYACFLRDLCNPIMTFELIMAKYSLEPSTIRLIINSFSLSINAVSSLCKSIGWLELAEIIHNIKNHLKSSISIRNVKYLYRITQEQKQCQAAHSATTATINGVIGSKVIQDYHYLDQLDISRIMNYVNSTISLSHHITPNVAISLYFSGLNCIENIATASTETLLRAIQNASKLDDYFGTFTNKPPEPNLNLIVICQEIVQQARKALSQLDNPRDLDSLSNSDIYTENNEIDTGLHDLDLEFDQDVEELLTAKSEAL